MEHNTTEVNTCHIKSHTDYNTADPTGRVAQVDDKRKATLIQETHLATITFLVPPPRPFVPIDLARAPS